MEEQTEVTPEQKLLKSLFNKMSMNDLPAMSSNVQELISLTNSSKATAQNLTEVILKDFSLTNKILQVANSAYYSRGTPIGTVQRATTAIGFTVVRQLAMAIALFEELIKNAEMKEQLVLLLSKSFLSAMMAKIHSDKTNLSIDPEEAFLCALLYNLGEIIVLVYLPELYKEVDDRIKSGKRIETACKKILNNLTFLDIGREISTLWNFSQIIHACQIMTPPRIKSPQDGKTNLKLLVYFTNHFVDELCDLKNPKFLVSDYGPGIKINLQTSVDLFYKAVDASAEISQMCRECFEKMDIQNILEYAKKVASK